MSGRLLVTARMVMAYTAITNPVEAERIAALANANGWCVFHAVWMDGGRVGKCMCADCMPNAVLKLDPRR